MARDEVGQDEEGTELEQPRLPQPGIHFMERKEDALLDLAVLADGVEVVGQFHVVDDEQLLIEPTHQDILHRQVADPLKGLHHDGAYPRLLPSRAVCCRLFPAARPPAISVSQRPGLDGAWAERREIQTNGPSGPPTPTNPLICTFCAQNPRMLVGANTRAVFGDYIDIYDIAQAVADGATVPIYYEARVAKIEFDDDMAALLDAEFDEATEPHSEDEQGAMARKWSRVEALVGAEKRLDAVVEDILQHFDARLEAMDGKAMIVCMSRRICVEVYKRIVAARPDWHGETDDTGSVKVVMTGNATDPASYQPHICSKSRQEVLRNRYRDPRDPLKLVIVRDMWLTGAL